MQTLRRLFAFASVIIFSGIVFATLAPIGFRPRLPISVAAERGLIFAALAFCLTIASRRTLAVLAISVIALAAALEAGQLLTSTRHGHLSHFIVKAGGAAVGAIAGEIVRCLIGLKGSPRGY